MNEAIRRMLQRYECHAAGDCLTALREILQSIALLGLWRSRFFEHAAFYGGSALRLIHGLDRYSEDLDFSLLQPAAGFDLGPYNAAVRAELESFGFDATVQTRAKGVQTAVASAFVKAQTRRQLLRIGAGEGIAGRIRANQVLKIRIEVDTDPPGMFLTETAYLLQPIPFAVRVYRRPDLFAGKMHAVLCRSWKSRVKGRDWYDLVWYAGNAPQLRLRHLEERMRQSGHWRSDRPLDREVLLELIHARIDKLDVGQIRTEVEPFLKDASATNVWSRDFFRRVIERIEIV